MSTYNTQNSRPTLLQQDATKNPLKKSNALSLRAELTLVILLLPIALFIVVVALAHTLPFIAGMLGAPLFTLVTPSAAVIFATLVPALSNPVHALLCLLGLFASTALIYLSLGAEYLGLVFTLVYLGAVAILFLYVIMLLNVKDIMSAQQAARSRGYRYVLSGLVGLLLLFRLPIKVQDGFQAAVLFSSESARAYRSPLTELTARLEPDILSLRGLYGDSWPLFIVQTIVLLIAMLGAIILATGSVEEDKPTRSKVADTSVTAVMLLVVTESKEVLTPAAEPLLSYTGLLLGASLVVGLGVGYYYYGFVVFKVAGALYARYAESPIVQTLVDETATVVILAVSIKVLEDPAAVIAILDAVVDPFVPSDSTLQPPEK